MFEIRRAKSSDVADLQELYLRYLTNQPPAEPQIEEDWVRLIDEVSTNANYNILVGVEDGKVVSSVTLIVIPNLTHNLRPYALIENVVTHQDYRGKGYASALLQRASEMAADRGCYKVMLMTGSKKESTLNFYRQNGYNSDEKTAFIKRV